MRRKYGAVLSAAGHHSNSRYAYTTGSGPETRREKKGENQENEKETGSNGSYVDVFAAWSTSC
ncbi:hypothetical protein J41TS2_19940 [Bacillus sonorensis]|nr:hypothetical protein J41TS2_19940 [Bacillus sonorensis]